MRFGDRRIIRVRIYVARLSHIGVGLMSSSLVHCVLLRIALEAIAGRICHHDRRH